jgi:hypothetical protein
MGRLCKTIPDKVNICISIIYELEAEFFLSHFKEAPHSQSQKEMQRLRAPIVK